MKLSEQGIKDQKAWKDAGFSLMKFNREKVRAATKKNPFWLHFGAGNIFRAFQANVVQKLLNAGELDRGLIVAEGYDYEIIEKVYRKYDDYSIAVTLKADGRIEKTVIGSVVESHILDSENEQEFGRLKEIFEQDSLQIVSFTITEKGYKLTNGEGKILSDVAFDLKTGPTKAKSYMGKITALLYMRFLAGEKHIAMVSMDNCSHNGDKLYAAVHRFAEEWTANGLVKAGFISYINDKMKVSFPWSMIDKITPRPDPSVEKLLRDDGVEDLEPVITSKNTYIASFVNAEECEYLVIEDSFPNGRPPLEKGGVIFTQRETVDKVERMKVCTCLNPLHTCLAIFGCILGYKKISDEMKDKQIVKLVEAAGYKEGLPAVEDPGILNPKEFIDTVLQVRIPNPFMPDTPQRIATDTSQKLAIRFGETIKAYQKSPELDISELKMIPLIFAGWLRYLMGIDDAGKKFELSPDPLMNVLRPYVENLKLGEKVDGDVLKPILEDKNIFGVNLYEVGMAESVIEIFNSMISEIGAVRKTLQSYI